MKPIVKIIATFAVATVATVIAAQELDEPSVVKAMVLTGRQDFQKAVAKADADYFKRLDPSANRLRLGRCRAIIATCKKTIVALERIAADAKRAGSDLEAGIARNKIDMVKDYLAKAEADMPQIAVPVKPVRPVRAVNTLGARSRFGRHTYLVIFRRVTWDQAKRMAESHGGYLASVESVQELMFLRKFVHTEAWMGGCPGGDPLQWRWLDGKKITDTFWEKVTPRVEANRRVRISSNGLGTQRATDSKDAFIIEWGR